jgi:hypothetical protein
LDRLRRVGERRAPSAAGRERGGAVAVDLDAGANRGKPRGGEAVVRSRVRFKVGDGEVVDLGHGDLIGRLWSAALQVDDPRVSEAHALVSLRGQELKLLALRGRFAIDGRPVAEATLTAGLRVELAPDLWLTVLEVDVPDEVLAIEADGLPRSVLHGTCALVSRPVPAVAAPTHPASAALVWCGPSGWRMRVSERVAVSGRGGAPGGGAADGEAAGERAAVTVSAGYEVVLDGVRWRFVSTSTERPATETRAHQGVQSPLRIVARYDSVHLFRTDQPVVVLDGISARIVSELIAFGGPVHWATLAEQIWPKSWDRKKLDMALLRMRNRLKEAGVRVDLVRSSGLGQIELLLEERDRVEDQS